MRLPWGPILAVCVGIAAAAAPILTSIDLAWKQGLAEESARVVSYGNVTLRRLDEPANQIRRALLQLSTSHLAPCSQAELDLMRRISLSESYFEGVGRTAGNQMICSSFGTTQPFSLGAPTVVTTNGLIERLHIYIPISDGHPINLFERDGFAFFMDPSLPVDIPAEIPGTSIAVFVPSSPDHAIIASVNRPMPEDWYRTIAPGSTLTFRSDGYIVAVARSASLDLAAVTAAPESYAWQHVRAFAFIFIPFGLLCAAGLGWAVAVISRSHLSLKAELRRAARRKEFLVEYQPIIDLNTRDVVGAEALVRWRRRDEIVRPDTFVPIAEESGVISQITACVAEIVAADLPALLRINPDFLIAINVSAADLREPATVDFVRHVLSSGIPPQHLMLEATERGLIQGNEADAVLNGIRALGAEIAIDDFGIGYSSLSRIKAIAPDAIKIDRSFTEAIGTDTVTDQVVSHIIEMAHSLNLTVIAEGVETESQATFMIERSVRYAQGFQYGRPMGVDDLSIALRKSKTRQERILIAS